MLFASEGVVVALEWRPKSMIKKQSLGKTYTEACHRRYKPWLGQLTVAVEFSSRCGENTL